MHVPVVWMLIVLQKFRIDIQGDTAGMCWGPFGCRTLEKTIMEPCPFDGDVGALASSLFFSFLSIK